MHVVAFKAPQPGQLPPFLSGIFFCVVQRNDCDAILQGRPLRPTAAADREHSGTVAEVQILGKCVLEVVNPLPSVKFLSQAGSEMQLSNREGSKAARSPSSVATNVICHF